MRPSIISLVQGCPENGFPNPPASAETTPTLGCICLLDLRHRSFHSRSSGHNRFPGFKGTWDLCCSEASDITWYMIPCISTFQLLFTSYRVLGCWVLLWRSPAWRRDSWRARFWERVFIGFLFSFSCDFHPMVEVTAWSLTSQISILIFGNAGLSPLVHQHHIFILSQDGVNPGYPSSDEWSERCYCSLWPRKDFPVLQRLWFLQLCCWGENDTLRIGAEV